MANKRILADITELQQPIYSSSGIYYCQNDRNIFQGNACIFGPEGTPYEDCPMMYTFSIDNGFPYDPPKVLFQTHDGITRFHPNMYREGKVCLSILGTWEGPKWASTMRLSTVLVTLQSLMDTNPILHEPGYPNPTKEIVEGYKLFVEHACIQYILERAESNHQPEVFIPFEDVFRERLPRTLERLEKRLLKLVEEGEKTLTNLPYQLWGKTQYSKLLQRVIKLKQ